MTFLELPTACQECKNIDALVLATVLSQLKLLSAKLDELDHAHKRLQDALVPLQSDVK